MITTCETMSKLVTHSSKLKCDDIRLKGLTSSYRACTECDLFLKEDLFHLVMQCPSTDEMRREMYSELYKFDNRIMGIFAENAHEVFNWLIGKPINDFEIDVMYGFWLITGTYIYAKCMLV